MSLHASLAPVWIESFVEASDGRFDTMQWCRSRTGAAGPFEPLTAPSWAAARIPADALRASAATEGRPLPLLGRALKLRIDERLDLTIRFARNQTASSAAVAIRGSDETPLDAFVTEEGKVAIETKRPGRGAAIRVVGGDAAPILELPLGVSFGKDPHTRLVRGKKRYVLADPYGERSFFYRTRLASSATGETGPMSAPIPAECPERLAPEHLARGVLRLLDPAGRPVRRRRVVLYARTESLRLGDTVLVTGTESKKTDDQGYVEFFLPRGLDLVVAVAGTNLVRDVRVPVDPEIDTFPLLGGEPDDAFRVRVPSLAGAPRSTL